MKCSNCGFISSKDFYRCPYCGKIHESEDNVFKKSLTIGNVFVVRLQTLIYIIVGNLFGASILVDWFLGFKYGIILWAFIILFGVILIISIAANKKNAISIVEKTDFFILLLPTFQVVAKRLGRDQAQAVLLAGIVEFYCR